MRSYTVVLHFPYFTKEKAKQMFYGTSEKCAIMKPIDIYNKTIKNIKKRLNKIREIGGRCSYSMGVKGSVMPWR